MDIAEREKKIALLELYAKLAEGERQIAAGQSMTLEEAKSKLKSSLEFRGQFRFADGYDYKALREER